MSYKAAWEAVESMNNLSINPIVQKETGGLGGGGTNLHLWRKSFNNLQYIKRGTIKIS